MVNEMRCDFCGLQKAHPCKTQQAAAKCRPAEERAVHALYAHSHVEVGTPRSRLSQQAIVRSLGQSTVIHCQDDPGGLDHTLTELARGCNAVVVQALPGGRLPIDVWTVVHDALSHGIPVYELDRDAEICKTVDRLDPSRCLSAEATAVVETALVEQAEGR